MRKVFFFLFAPGITVGEIKAQEVPTIGLYLRHNALKSCSLNKTLLKLKKLFGRYYYFENVFEMRIENGGSMKAIFNSIKLNLVSLFFKISLDNPNMSSLNIYHAKCQVRILRTLGIGKSKMCSVFDQNDAQFIEEIGTFLQLQLNELNFNLVDLWVKLCRIEQSILRSFQLQIQNSANTGCGLLNVH